MEVEILIPIAGMAMIVLIVWISVNAATKRRSEAYQTLRLAVEKGQPITPDAMDAMARMSSPLADLRRGIIFVAIALAVAAFGALIGSDQSDALKPLLGIALFPFFLGAAFLGLHIFANETKRR